MKLIEKKNFDIFFYFLALAIFFVFAGFSVYGDDGLLHLLQLKRLKNSLAEQNKKLLSENIACLQDLKNMQRPSALENRVRESLGWVHEDEIVYVIDGQGVK